MPSKETQRLRWQCRRGMLELDYLLENYLDQQFENAQKEEREAFILLLDQHDLDLQQWLLLGASPVNLTLTFIVDKVRTV